MKTVFAHILTFTFLLVFATVATAQEITLPSYRQYGLKDGLPQAQITTLFQDSRGYIWAGTNNGLARFNGEKFFSFTVKNGFPFSYVNSFAEDGQGRIWAFCRHGISCINGDSITSFPQNEHLLNRMSPGSADTLWFAATRKEDNHRRLGYFANDSYHFIDIPDEDLRTSDFTFFEYDKQRNRILFSNLNKIYQYYNGKFIAIKRLFMDENFHLSNVELVNSELLAIYYSWMKKEFHFYIIDSNEYKRIGVLSDGIWTEPLPEKYKKGFSLFNPGEGYFLENDEIHRFNISEHHIMNMLKDRDGNYWFGAERGLLQRFSEAFTNYNSTNLPEVWSVTEQPKGQYWFSSFSFGLKTLKDGKLSPVLFNGKEINWHYFHPSAGNNGTIYFPVSDGVLKHSPDGSMKMLRYTWNETPICFYTYYDRERNCLLGGFRGNVAVWDDNDQLIREIGRASDDNFYGFVHCIAQDSARNYWFGSPDIYHYNWDTGALKKYAWSAAIQNCFDIATDANGTTWFGTQKGLYYYDRQADTLKRVNSPQLEEWVLMVFPIDSDRLLLSQPNGLYVLDLEKFNRNGEISLSLYNKANGYLADEPGQAGAFRDSEGNIWVTGVETLCRIKPNLLPRSDTLKISPLFTRCNNQPVLYDQHEILLPLNENSVTVVLDAVAFNRPRPVEYNYRINTNNEWSKPQAENYITLTDLPHGKNTLFVRASFQGMENTTISSEKALIIHINQAFYNQAWFVPLVLFVLLLTIIVMTLVYGRTQTRLQKTLMRAKYAETETIQAQMNPHFVYNVLTNVQSRIRDLRIDEAENSLLKLAHLTRRFMHTFSQSAMDDKSNKIDIQQNTTSLTNELSLLQEFIDFQQMLYPETFVYVLSFSNDVEAEKVKIPPMLLQPFVENAISHGLIPKKSIGKLQIDISRNPETEKTIIRIMDDGIGMEQSLQIQQQSTLRYPSRGRKLTLQRIQLLNELGFHIGVNTETSTKGTTVTIIL